MEPQSTRVERITSRIKSNPVVASLIVLGTVVIALSTFTDAANKLLAVVSKPSPAAARTALAQMSLEYTPEAFLASAGTGDLTAVKLFLTAGMDPDASNEEGDTALASAAYKGHAQTVAALVNAGAAVAKTPGHRSALVADLLVDEVIAQEKMPVRVEWHLADIDFRPENSQKLDKIITLLEGMKKA